MNIQTELAKKGVQAYSASDGIIIRDTQSSKIVATCSMEELDGWDGKEATLAGILLKLKI